MMQAHRPTRDLAIVSYSILVPQAQVDGPGAAGEVVQPEGS